MDFYGIIENDVSTHSQETILLGDFNLSKNCTLVSALKYMCSLFSFTQIIHNHTRVSLDSSTIIDLMLVSNYDKNSQSGVVDCCLSDHLMIFYTKGTLGEHNTIDIRSLKNYSQDAFHQSLVGSDWSNVLISNEVDTVW